MEAERFSPQIHRSVQGLLELNVWARQSGTQIFFVGRII